MSESVSAEKVRTGTKSLEVMLPDTRGVTISPWMRGNLKLGPDVVSFSRLPGRPRPHGGTCPGATPECLSFCYAFAIKSSKPVWEVYERNSQPLGQHEKLPPLPEGTQFVRIHVSGDFDTPRYILAWIDLIRENPDVKFWAYTRSWRAPELLPLLEELRALPNLQLFASVDKSTNLPPAGWRRAWIAGDERIYGDGARRKVWNAEKAALTPVALVCPEERKMIGDCQSCGFCIVAPVSSPIQDVIFLPH